jgi:hypothetical protein
MSENLTSLIHSVADVYGTLQADSTLSVPARSQYRTQMQDYITTINSKFTVDQVREALRDVTTMRQRYAHTSGKQGFAADRDRLAAQWLAYDGRRTLTGKSVVVAAPIVATPVVITQVAAKSTPPTQRSRGVAIIF